jgi:hypothetical protein
LVPVILDFPLPVWRYDNVLYPFVTGDFEK